MLLLPLLLALLVLELKNDDDSPCSFPSPSLMIALLRRFGIDGDGEDGVEEDGDEEFMRRRLLPLREKLAPRMAKEP